MFRETVDNKRVRPKKILSFSLIVCLFFSFLFVFSCGKKTPEAPKVPEKKVEVPPPKVPEPPRPPEPQKPPEAPKQAVEEERKAPEPKEAEKPIPYKHEKGLVKKRTPPPKPKAPAPPVPYPKRYTSLQIVSLDELNRQLKTHRLNVWASELSSKGILLNGYVKNEKERQDALALAGRYNPNIIDMINVVTVYDNRIPGTSRQ